MVIASAYPDGLRANGDRFEVCPPDVFVMHIFFDYISIIKRYYVNRRQRRTLAAIFENPVRADVPWADIESLLRALGAEIKEGSGSRVRIALHGVRAVFHRPHPHPDTDKGALRSMRRFLTEAGITLC